MFLLCMSKEKLNLKKIWEQNFFIFTERNIEQELISKMSHSIVVVKNVQFLLLITNISLVLYSK